MNFELRHAESSSLTRSNCAGMEPGSPALGAQSLSHWATWEVPQEKKESEVAQSCLTLCHPMDCSLPGFSVHGIFQARILEWVAVSFSRGLSQLRD